MSTQPRPAILPFRRAAILAVGSELLMPTRIDTNSLHITETLNGIGIDVIFKGIVGDDRVELGHQFEHLLARVDLLVMTGGLGPTEDDLTRDVVAERLRLPMTEDSAIVAVIRKRFEARGWTMPEINRRQAMVPRGATVLDNPHGSAPGLWIEAGDKGVLLMPGPPREMKPMLQRVVDEFLRPRTGGSRVARRLLRIAGRSESRVEELTQPVYSQWRDRAVPIETTILAAPGMIELHLSARGSDEQAMAGALDAAVDEIAAVMTHDLFSRDGRGLDEVVGALLRERGWRVAIAESCTGGLATSRLTDVPGSSDYVERGVIAYSNEAKIDLLAVPRALIEQHGAVSEPVAEAMAFGMRTRAGVDAGLGITGIAGPGGGSEAKPVGTVCIAVATADGAATRTFRFPGNRELVKTFAALTAIDMLRRVLISAPAHADWTKR